MLQETAILILSLAGLLLAYYLWHTKVNRKDLYCVIGKDCNIVIHSEHSKHFGVENSVLGVLYYILLIVVSVAYPFLLIAPVPLYILLITGVAALFSLYLAGLQLFHLSEFCEYCLVNTGIVLTIFLVLLL